MVYLKCNQKVGCNEKEATVVISKINRIFPDRISWEFVVAGILGILLVIAPFALNFFSLTEAIWFSINLGAMVAILFGIQPRQMVPSTVKERFNQRDHS
jgi:hypothetical protein